jgi:ADP-heptose:LPS heptosyltransferase
VNIAVVVSGGISETILATPLLSTLRGGESDTRLVLLCPAEAGAIAAGVPNLDEVVPLQALNGSMDTAGCLRIWLELRRRRIETVMLCTSEAGARVAAYFAACPQRVGPARRVGRLLLTASTTPSPHENVARTWLRLATLVGIRTESHKPAFDPGREAQERADWMIGGSSVADGRLLVAIAPAATADAADSGPARWPPERYAHLANQLAMRHGAAIALVGLASDRGVIEQTKLDLGAASVDVAGATDLRTIAAVLARCDLLVGGETPLLHLAAAVGTPTVGLFGPTDGVRLGPYGADHRVIQALPQASIAGRRTTTPAALEQIRVEDVLASIESTF